MDNIICWYSWCKISICIRGWLLGNLIWIMCWLCWINIWCGIIRSLDWFPQWKWTVSTHKSKTKQQRKMKWNEWKRYCFVQFPWKSLLSTDLKFNLLFWMGNMFDLVFGHNILLVVYELWMVSFDKFHMKFIWFSFG